MNSETVTRLDLEQAIHAKTGINQDQIREALQYLMGCYFCEDGKPGKPKNEHFDGVIAEHLNEGRKVELRNFGTFYPKTRKARPARNPRTGAVVWLPVRRVALWRPSPELLENK